MCLRPFGLYYSACLGILFVSILCMCCSHFSWYCFISFTIFSAPDFSLIQWFFSLSSFVIPRRCLKNFICAASKRCSSLFFSTQASLPNFNYVFVNFLNLQDTCCSTGGSFSFCLVFVRKFCFQNFGMVYYTPAFKFLHRILMQHLQLTLCNDPKDFPFILLISPRSYVYKAVDNFPLLGPVRFVPKLMQMNWNLVNY